MKELGLFLDALFAEIGYDVGRRFQLEISHPLIRGEMPDLTFAARTLSSFAYDQERQRWDEGSEFDDDEFDDDEFDSYMETVAATDEGNDWKTRTFSINTDDARDCR